MSTATALKTTIFGDKEFSDISSELFRVYVYDTGFRYRIDEPQWLHVSASGGHRVVDTSNNSYYIASGWVAIEWTKREGQDPFIF